MKTRFRKLRLPALVFGMVMVAFAFGMVSCGTIRTHGGVEFENEYYLDGHDPHHKHKKDKKPKPKKPKKHHDHD